MKATVYYDYYDGVKAPKWYVLYFGSNNIDWEKDYIFLPIIAPFELHGVEDFDNEIMSASITIGDLIKKDENPNELGIYLPRVRKTITDFGGEVQDVSQFIMLVSDIEEVLQMNAIRAHLEW